MAQAKNQKQHSCDDTLLQVLNVHAKLTQEVTVSQASSVTISLSIVLISHFFAKMNLSSPVLTILQKKCQQNHHLCSLLVH